MRQEGLYYYIILLRYPEPIEINGNMVMPDTFRMDIIINDQLIKDEGALEFAKKDWISDYKKAVYKQKLIKISSEPKTHSGGKSLADYNGTSIAPFKYEYDEKGDIIKASLDLSEWESNFKQNGAQNGALENKESAND